MNLLHARGRWLRTVMVPSGLIVFVLTGCASVAPDEVKSAPAVSAASPPSEDDDWTQLTTQMRIDLNRLNTREIARIPLASPAPASAQARDNAFGARAQALFAPLNKLALRLPVVGVRTASLDDSWHAPRDGGARVHKGIDILAPKGTEVVDVVERVISVIGDQICSGHC